MSIWTDLAGLPFTLRQVDVRGVRTRVLEAGSGEPLVLLHGTGGHVEAFARNVAALAQRYRVVVLDMIGHGCTDAPDIDYTVDTLIDHVRDTLDVLGLARVNIGGVSLGGMISLWLAIRHPERVLRVITITFMLGKREASGKNELKDALARTRKAAETLTRDAVRARLAWLMADPDKSVTEELVDVRHAIYGMPGRAPIIARIQAVIVNGVNDDAWAEQWSSERHLEQIRCPVLAIWSAHNPGMNAERAQRGLAHIANGRMVVFEHSGHWPQWEEPELFNRTCLEFLAST